MQHFKEEYDDVVRLLPSDAWRARLLHHGWHDLEDPEHRLWEDLDVESNASHRLLVECAEFMSEATWAKAFLAEVDEVARMRAQMPTTSHAEDPPHHRGQSDRGRSRSPRVKQEPGAPPAVHRPLLARELEEMLFAHCQYTPIEARPMDYAQVLRGLLALAREWYGQEWPERVAIVNASEEESRRVLLLQQQPELILALVLSATHWALLAVDTRSQEAVIYDGLGDATCLDAAHALLHHLHASGRVARPVRLQQAFCPAQPDSWSCGHRAVLYADAVLDFRSHLRAASRGPCLPTVLTEEMVNSKLVMALVDRSAKCRQAKKERDEAAALNCTVDSHLHHDHDVQDSAPCTPPARKRAASCLDMSPGSSPATPPKKSPAVKKVPRRAQAAKAPKASDQAKPTVQSKKLDEAASECRRKALEDLEQKGASHKIFQKRHYAESIQPPKGHWQVCVDAFLDPTQDLACSVCSQLLHEARGAAAERASSMSSMPEMMEEKPVVPPVHEQKPRKAGRPRKDEDPASRFSLAQYIKEHRAAVYLQTAKSFQRCATYHCRACGCDVQFQSLTNKGKLDRHETYQRHQAGLKKLMGVDVPAASPRDGETETVAQGTRSTARCTGVSSSNPSLPLFRYKESWENFAYAGQPRTNFASGESDPMDGVLLQVVSDGVVLQSQRCTGQANSGGIVCNECLGLSKKKALRSYVAQKSYLVDLAMLTWKAFHSPAADYDAFTQTMLGRDYRQFGVAGGDLERLLSAPSKIDLCKRVYQKFHCIPVWRQGASLKRLMSCWLQKPQHYHSHDVEAEAYGTLCMNMTSAIANGSARELDLRLASKVAAGALRHDVVVESLVTSFLMQIKKGLSDCVRQTTGAFANYEALAEALGTLGRSSEVKELLATFKVNPKKLPTVDLRNQQYPGAFLALNSKDQLMQSIRSAVALLKTAGGRPHIIVDETTWSPSWDQVRGIRHDDQGRLADGIVGGSWSPVSENDWSMLDAEIYSPQNLSSEYLAKLALHVVIQRADNVQYTFDIAVLPRPQGIGTAEETMQIVAQVLDGCVQANGIAPQGCAFDGGSNNNLVNQALAGVLDAAKMEALPFFRECTVHDLPFSYWAYRMVRHRQELLVSMNGAYHWQKRYSLQFIAGCRSIFLGGLWVDITAELGAGLPIHAYMAMDQQSDAAAVQRLSPPFLGQGWSSLGIHIHALISALICSSTTGSIGFAKTDIALNAFTGYYCLVLHAAENWRRFPQDFRQRTLAEVTLRNGCMLCHYAASQLDEPPFPNTKHPQPIN